MTILFCLIADAFLGGGGGWGRGGEEGGGVGWELCVFESSSLLSGFAMLITAYMMLLYCNRMQ